MVAPAVLPSPPRMTIANAFRFTRSPIVGLTMKTGPSSAPATAASPEPSAKVSVFMPPTLTPIRAAASRSWNVAFIDMPIRVRLMRRWNETRRTRAAANTKSRIGSTETGPMTIGACEKGDGTSLATPPHTNCSAFCIAIQAPIMTIMTESMSVDRMRRSSTNSRNAPSATPSPAAKAMERKKSSLSCAARR